jgi:hypothetical protein
MTPDLRRELERFIRSADPLISILERDIDTAKFLLENPNDPDLRGGFPVPKQKLRCCPNMPARKVPRSIHENARDVARDIARTEAYVTSRRERKKIEMLFAHLKRILRLDRLRLRGPFGARDEFLLAATAQNLRKLAKLIPLHLKVSMPSESGS